MSKAEEFKRWCSERQGYPPQIKTALEAIIELENETELAKQALFKVGQEINEETRMSKNSKSFAVAIVLNELSNYDQHKLL